MCAGKDTSHAEVMVAMVTSLQDGLQWAPVPGAYNDYSVFFSIVPGLVCLVSGGQHKDEGY